MSQTGTEVTSPKPNQDEKQHKKKLKSKHRRANTTKIRVKLPTIDAYQREVIFRAEGPGRVVVRLERLMGDDRIRLTDLKFMSTLLERLEEDERKAWDMRTTARTKGESNRSRHLAIEGLMEPTSDMQDLYSHPVFRVNRVLKRLALFDQRMTAGQDNHLPPITAIDPFANDDTGGIFKSYPGHKPVDVEEMSELGSRADLYAELQGDIPSEQLKMSYMKTNDEEEDATDFEVEEEFDDEEEEVIEIPSPHSMDEEWAGEDGEPTMSPMTSKLSPDGVLTDIQQGYGIKPEIDLGANWDPYQSHLVDLIFNEDGGDIDELYEIADQVLRVYRRENLKVDEFLKTLPRMLQDQKPTRDSINKD